MKYLYVVLIVVAVLTVRLTLLRRGRPQRRSSSGAPDVAREGLPAPTTRPGSQAARPAQSWGAPRWTGDVGLIAAREIRERVRGRIFRVGTLIILLVVAAAILIPKLQNGSSQTVQTVGVVGDETPAIEQIVTTAGKQNQDTVHLRVEPSVRAAEAALRAGTIDLAVLNGDQILLSQPATSKNAPADPGLVTEIAGYLGLVRSYQDAGLSPSQVSDVAHAKAVPVHSLEGGSKSATQATSVIGIVLLFLMLTQYCTWILIGVMQEKSSRVVEVLLATVRPIQLLGGKVLGIGLVALGQAGLIVGFALALGAVVGSDLLRGTAPVALLAELFWLVLGYAFYCWVYAAAGSTAERQDQVQTLALPLSLPMLIGYIFSITVASSGDASVFFKVLAYFPPTAPFCMSALVGLNQATWWEFAASALITIGATAGMAVFAARIYRRAVLRTGARVRFRDVVARSAT
jgi:ABC-2 type transport system permease protein